MVPEAVGEIINIGNPDQAYSINELAQIGKELANSSSELKVTHSTEADVRYRVPNVDKAKQVLGFKPAVSLREGMKRTLDWLVTTL